MRPPPAPPEGEAPPGGGLPEEGRPRAREEAARGEVPTARLRLTSWMFGAFAGFLILGTVFLLLLALFLGGEGEVEAIRAAWPPKPAPPLPAGARPVQWQGVEFALPPGARLVRGEGSLTVEFPGRCAPGLRRVALGPGECLLLTLRRGAPGGSPPPREARPLVAGELRGSWWFGASWAPANYRVWELSAWLEGRGARHLLVARGHHLAAPPREAFEAEVWPLLFSLRPAG